MPWRPNKIFVVAACIVGASGFAFPYLPGTGATLLFLIEVFTWNIVARLTSGLYADTHHTVLWPVAFILNLSIYLVFAAGVSIAVRRRWPVWESVATCGWCVFYLASLFWLFPAGEGL